MDDLAAVRHWLQHTVVGLDLCPYARGPWTTGRVRLAFAPGDLERRLTAVTLEGERLVGTDPAEIETTVVVVPDAPSDFEAFLDDTELAQELVASVAGEALQVVAFHPAFRFEGADVHDPANAVNRSPVPLWHLLREKSVSKVVARDPDGVAAVPGRNRDLLRRLAHDVGEG